MTTPTTADLERLLSEITPGPWTHFMGDICADQSGDDVLICGMNKSCGARSSDYLSYKANTPTAQANARAIAMLPDRLAEVIAARRAAPSGWRDIATAPRDGLIDIWAVDNGDRGRRVTGCYYDSICDEWRTSEPALKLHCVKARYVTHWMPLPAAPVDDSAAPESDHQTGLMSADERQTDSAPAIWPTEQDVINATEGGLWRTCSGCHEYHEGVATGLWHPTLKTHIGNGCAECGGIGAVWDNTDYSDFGEVVAQVPLTTAPIKMIYRNYRGEIAERTVTPKIIWWGATEWHPEPGWLMKAYDHDKQEDRDFALADCQFADLPPASAESALRGKIESIIEDHMVDAEVDFPAGREAGPSIQWDSDALLDAIMTVIHPAPMNAQASAQMLPRAVGEDRKAGWTLPVSDLSSIKHHVYREFGEIVSLEAVEIIALEVERALATEADQ